MLVAKNVSTREAFVMVLSFSAKVSPGLQRPAAVSDKGQFEVLPHPWYQSHPHRLAGHA